MGICVEKLDSQPLLIFFYSNLLKRLKNITVLIIQARQVIQTSHICTLERLACCHPNKQASRHGSLVNTLACDEKSLQFKPLSGQGSEIFNK